MEKTNNFFNHPISAFKSIPSKISYATQKISNFFKVFLTIFSAIVKSKDLSSTILEAGKLQFTARKFSTSKSDQNSKGIDANSKPSAVKSPVPDANSNDSNVNSDDDSETDIYEDAKDHWEDEDEIEQPGTLNPTRVAIINEIVASKVEPNVQEFAAKVVESPVLAVQDLAGKAVANIEPKLSRPIQAVIGLLPRITHVNGNPGQTLASFLENAEDDAQKMLGMTLNQSVSIFFQLMKVMNKVTEEHRTGFQSQLKDALPAALAAVQEGLKNNQFTATLVPGAAKSQPKTPEEIFQFLLPQILPALADCQNLTDASNAAIFTLQKVIESTLNIKIESNLTIDSKASLVANVLTYTLAIVLLTARNEVDVARNLAALDKKKVLESKGSAVPEFEVIKANLKDAEIRPYLIPGSLAFTICKDLSPHGGIADAGPAIHAPNPLFAKWFLSNNTNPWMPQRIVKWAIKKYQNIFIPKDIRPMYANLGLLPYEDLKSSFDTSRARVIAGNIPNWQELCTHLRVINEMGLMFGIAPLTPAELYSSVKNDIYGNQDFSRIIDKLNIRADLISAQFCEGDSTLEENYEAAIRDTADAKPIKFKTIKHLKEIAKALGVEHKDTQLKKFETLTEDDRKSTATILIESIKIARAARLRKIKAIQTPENEALKAEARNELKNVLQEFLHGPLFTNIAKLNKEKAIILELYNFVAGVSEEDSLNSLIGNVIGKINEFAPALM
jgi:hypothetical protein